MYDEHRIDDPRYRPPAKRGKQPAPPVMTVAPGGIDDPRRASQPAADQPLSAVEAAQACYDTLVKIPTDQQKFNDDVDRRAEHLRREYGVHDDQVAKFIAQERAKFADTTPALMPDAARTFIAEQQAEAERKAAEVRAGLSPKSDDVAELMRQQAIWNRERPKLDAKADKGSVAKAAVDAIANAGDPEELKVFATELPSYLQARGVDDTSFLEP